MTTSTKNRSDLGSFFYRALAAAAMIVPMCLVVAASALPEGLERGDFIVNGHGVLLAVLVAALVLRAVFARGFRKALKIVTSNPNRSVTV
jgi:threonine/homoserine/homoserine lactone efflux protein